MMHHGKVQVPRYFRWGAIPWILVQMPELPTEQEFWGEELEEELSRLSYA
jgi:hypothetical protein